MILADYDLDFNPDLVQMLDGIKYFEIHLHVGPWGNNRDKSTSIIHGYDDSTFTKVGVAFASQNITY